MVQRRTVACALAAQPAADLPVTVGVRIGGVLAQRTGPYPKVARRQPISPDALTRVRHLTVGPAVHLGTPQTWRSWDR